MLISMTKADWKRILRMVEVGYKDDGDGRYLSIEESAEREDIAMMKAAKRLKEQLRK